MNHAPQKSDADSQVAQSPQASTANAELEIECIDLVCKLEHQLAVAKEGYRDDQVTESAVTSEQMLNLLCWSSLKLIFRMIWKSCKLP